MTILLDIDGVLVTTPIWKKVEYREADNFAEFDAKAAENLNWILSQTEADIVLTSSHRFTFSSPTWKSIFLSRGIKAGTIKRLRVTAESNAGPKRTRADEINRWVDQYGAKQNFVIIDDDTSINDLSHSIKERAVITKPLIGLDRESAERAVKILMQTTT